LPDKGRNDQALKPVDMSQTWLAPFFLSEEAQPAAAFKGDPNTAVWLPNAAVARAWMEYVKTGAVSDTTPPPAPSQVNVTDKGKQGTEITWDAEADFESGIRAFILLRDGEAGRQIRTPSVPIHDVSRHTGPTDAGNALRGHFGQGGRETFLFCHHREQRRTEIGAVCFPNAVMQSA
jgi:hypothetical protein